MMCTLKKGEGHAFLVSDEGVLDNRFNAVVDFERVGCDFR